MNKIVPFLVLQLSLVCFTSFSRANVVAADPSANPSYLKTQYSFPYANPYFSSLTVKLLKASGQAPTALNLAGVWKRDQMPGFEKIAQMNVAAYAQKNKAPLVYVIPGLGATAYDSGGEFLAEQLFHRGFSVIIIPSPLFWRFALTQSTTGIVGYPPADAADLRHVMLQSRITAERVLHLKVSRSAVVGYSLGAINAAFVMTLERKSPLLGLERAVMIDPPLRMSVAIDELDRLSHSGDKLSVQDKKMTWAHVYAEGGAYLSRDIKNPNYFLGLDKKLNLSDTQVQYLIGSSFQQSLVDTIYVGQHITDLGLIDVKADYQSAKHAASQISYNDYVTKALWPFWSKKLNMNISRDEFLTRGDLISLKDTFAKDEAFRLLHNMDDYLIRPDDLREVANVMGNRVIIYPTGGHVGNMWKAQNQEDIYSMIKDLL
jgi:hypothetical protein